MATELATIISNLQTAVQTSMTTAGITLSTSQVAEWLLWCESVAQAIHDFEVVQDELQSDVETYVSTKQPGSISWYVDIAEQWQYGDTVSVSSTGQLYYATTDTTKQLIAQCSVTEVVASGVTTLLMKVAKDDGSGNLIPLTDEELLEFTAYMTKAKFAGTYLKIVSQNADSILYNYDVKYSGLYSATAMQTALATAVAAFKTVARFDALFYSSAFEAALLAVAGVIAVNKNTLQGKQDGGTYADLGLSYALQSGYFNFDSNSAFNLIAG